MNAAEPETLVCDTSIASMLRFATMRPRVLEHWPGDTLDRLNSALLTVSVVTLAEVEYGLIKNNAPAELILNERRRLSYFGLLPIDPEVVLNWGALKNALRLNGRQCGDNDIWIAATARTRGATVVTADADFLALADHLDVLYLKRTPDSREA